MGYVYPNKWNYVDIPCQFPTNITLTTVAGNKALVPIVVPDFEGVLKSAYLNTIIAYINDTSGAINYTDPQGQDVEIEIDSVYIPGTLIPAGSLYTPANGWQGHTHILGSQDVSSGLDPDTTYNVRWGDGQSKGNNLVLYGVQAYLRLYFG